MKFSSCKYCGQIFTTTSFEQYCSERCKEKYWNESNASIDSYFCYYCGSTADSIDHVPPESARKELISLGLQFKYPFKEVKCCRECNSILGARSLWTLSARKRYIKNELEKKYGKFLRIPDWSERELGELEENFKNYILTSIKTRNIIRNRLRW